MSLIAQKVSGCYRRILLFLIAILIVGIGIGVLVYNQVGGTEGFRYWTAARALNGTEKLVLTNRPDGVSQEEVEEQFQDVLDAIKSRQIDLISLYELLKSYQTKFHISGLSKVDIKPSTPEIEEFLTQLEDTIIREE